MASRRRHPALNRTSYRDRSSLPTLKYPAVDVEDNVNYWLHSSCPPVMSAPSETHSDDFGSLGESSYDFVDSEEESRDGNTESIASTDFGRPDDIASLDDTEQSDNEGSVSNQSHDTDGIPAYTGLDSPHQTPLAAGSAAVFSDEVDRTLAHSIEFEEPLSLGDENVSVKHTVTEFTEEQTLRIAQNLMLRSPPRRLVATIRQTMTRQGLSTREPLRLLYVGCHTAKQDIIRKIASSVAASVTTGRSDGASGHRSSQLFHVVPITAFGSERLPEIELMQSSGYQINVEDCSGATNIKYGDKSERADVLRLVVEDGYAYESIPVGSGFRLEPAWDLPHVAIFYSSENDTVEMKRMRTIAKTFMSRHKVPSIVISHKQMFEQPFGGIALDQHVIHMCLESRDPNEPRNTIHQRLPIDLDSFKTIDARQMNRNLAYITGLHEPLHGPLQSAAGNKARPLVADIEKTSYGLSDSVTFLRTRTGAEWRALMPVGLFLLTALAAVVVGSWKYGVASTHAVSINGNLTFTEPTSAISSPTMTPTPEVIASLLTSTETRTQTKTITVIQSKSPMSNSLALAPSMELGKLMEKAHTPADVKSQQRSTVCSAEALGDREILIRIPEATKLTWLSKEAMSVNVSRERVSVETDRVYTTTDGIILRLAKEEAHGILNVSIITTRRPKINETFTVDFGPVWSHSVLDLLQAWLPTRIRTANENIETTVIRWWKHAQRSATKSPLISELARKRLEDANKLAAETAAESSERIAKVAKDISMELAKWSAILSKEVRMRASEARCRLSKVRQEVEAFRNQDIREPLDVILMRAQVRSKLYWLKLQGRDAEYEEYEKRAAVATKRRLAEAEKVRAKSTKDTKKKSSCPWKKSSCHKKKNSCAT